MTPTQPTDAWVSDVVDLLGDILTLDYHNKADNLDSGLRLKRRAEAALTALGLTPDVQAMLREAAQMHMRARQLRHEADQLDTGADEFVASKVRHGLLPSSADDVALDLAK